MTKGKQLAFVRKIAAVVTALCVMLTLSSFALADAATNEAVTESTNGVVQVKLVYVDPASQDKSNIQSGTGFLINDSTVITCDHVVSMSDETLAEAVALFGVDENTVKNNCQIEITVLRDLTIRATVTHASAEMDYAILSLSTQLYDRTYLPIRSSAEVQRTEASYALGFPGQVSFFQDVNTYTSDDVTIRTGSVNNTNTINGVDYIQTSASITSGFSGGPLLDENGAVVGICQGYTGELFDKDYFYAIAIDQLTQSLRSLGIAYTEYSGSTVTPDAASGSAPAASASEPASEPASQPAQTVDKTSLQSLVDEAEDCDTTEYTTESAQAFTAALSEAKAVLGSETATQEQVDSAYNALNDAFNALEVAGNNMILFIIIGCAAAVVVIVIVVVIVVVSKSKKKSSSYAKGAPAAVPAAAQQNAPFAPVNAAAAPTVPSYGATGAGETTVLSQGAGETTVLGAGAGTGYGTLTRSKTGESIRINSAEFIIGKERAKVSYCVTDNTSVSRAHASIRTRGGSACIVDLRATNGTFVNGVRLTPGQEAPIKNGDVIMLADEEFVYYA